METATVEQAEPQGSAAPTPDTSAPASGNPPASAVSFGTLFRQYADRKSTRAGASSARVETSAADEQPAPSEPTASRPGAAAEAVDGTAPSGVESSSSQPRLSRAERKALKSQGQTSEQPTTAEPPADTSAGDTADPIVARVERVEKTVTEGISRLEGLLSRPTPAQADPAEDGESRAYLARYGDDKEFKRRADIMLHGALRGEYLSTQEADETAIWAQNRETRDLESARLNRQYQSNFSNVVLAAADEFGINKDDLQKPGTTFRNIFETFVNFGEARSAPKLEAAQTRITELEKANRLLADENEALSKRLPATSRPILTGGLSSSSKAAALADRSNMNGRQLMAAGLSSAGRRRPGAR